MKGGGEKGREVENPPQLDLTAFLSHLTNSHTGLYCLAKTWTKVLPCLPFLRLVLGFFYLSLTHARTYAQTHRHSSFLLPLIYLFSFLSIWRIYREISKECIPEAAWLSFMYPLFPDHFTAAVFANSRDDPPKDCLPLYIHPYINTSAGLV